MRTLAILAAVVATVGCSSESPGEAARAAAYKEIKRLDDLALARASLKSRDEFRALVEGKEWNDVVKAVGRPDRTQDTTGDVFWYYQGRTYDPVTGKLDAMAQLTIRHMTVKGVSFY